MKSADLISQIMSWLNEELYKNIYNEKYSCENTPDGIERCIENASYSQQRRALVSLD